VQAEKENLVIYARRPKKGEPNLDFVIDGPGPYKYVDVKNPKDQRKFDKKPNSNDNAAESMGKKITMQKGTVLTIIRGQNSSILQKILNQKWKAILKNQ